MMKKCRATANFVGILLAIAIMFAGIFVPTFFCAGKKMLSSERYKDSLRKTIISYTPILLLHRLWNKMHFKIQMNYVPSYMLGALANKTLCANPLIMSIPWSRPLKAQSSKLGN